MAILGNRVYVNTATTGTGTVTLGAAFSNAFCTFAEAGVSNTDTVAYCIEEGNDFEIGTGVYTSSGTTLSRVLVTLSKIGGTAGTTKMTLAGAATVRIVARKEDVNGTPYFSAYLSADQSVTVATYTKILFDTVNWDSNSYWDATNKRYTPLIAGKYQVMVAADLSSTTVSSGVYYQVDVYKNGSRLGATYMTGSIIGSNEYLVNVSMQVSLNGSTDYVEGFVNIQAGTSPTVGGLAVGTRIEIFYIGP